MRSSTGEVYRFLAKIVQALPWDEVLYCIAVGCILAIVPVGVFLDGGGGKRRRDEWDFFLCLELGSG